MPYTVAKNGPDDKPYCVYKKNLDTNEPEGDTLGCHETAEQAGAQIGAIEASEAGKCISVKAVGDWELDVLGLPYGGPYNGKDEDGEHFDARTETHDDKWPLPPVVYAHGRGQYKPAYIGRTVKRWRDAAGEWFRVVLDKGHEFAERVMLAAREGRAAASSGTAAHLMRKDADGHIREWPVLELSIFDVTDAQKPANPFAVVRPVAALKAIYEDAGIPLPDGIDAQEAEPEAGTPAATVGADVITESLKEGETTMDEKDIKTIVTETVNAMKTPGELDALKTEVAGLKGELKAIRETPPAFDGGSVKVTKDPADNEFVSTAEQCFAIKAYALSHGRAQDPRLSRLMKWDSETKQTGANEGVPADGGFLLEPTLAAAFLKPVHEEGPFTRLCSKLPVGTNSNSGWINGVNETARTLGNRWGGIRGYWLGEADTKTASRPAFRRINWELHKIAVLVWATDELLQDAAMFSGIVQQAASEELSFMVNDAILTGAGAVTLLGILTSGALVTVAALAGQLADTVVTENLNQMWQRLLPASKPKSAWFINSEVMPQLDELTIAVGASALEPRFVTYDQAGAIRLKGRPVYETEFNSAIGVVGDIVLADMSEYLFWEKGGVQSASSIHVHFTTDETVFRFVYRCDGQPSMAAPITPYRASAGATQSAFVTLAAR